MATIKPYEIKSGKRYMVRYRKPNGKQTDKGGFRTKREAQAWLQEVEVDKRAGRFVDPTLGKTDLAVVGERWLKSKKHRKPTSYRRYEGTWLNQVKPAWADRAVDSITSSEIQDWIDDMTLSPSSIIKAHQVLAQILDIAVRDRMTAFNRARDGIELPSVTRREPIFLTVDQLWELARAAGSHHDDVLLLGYTGIRWSEMTGLSVRRWDSRRRRLRIVDTAGSMGWTSTKTRKGRSVPVPGVVATLLDERCEGKGPGDLIFPNGAGEPMSNSNARRDWFTPAVVAVFGAASEATGKRVRTAGARPKVNVTPHDLRHTAASLAIKAGASVKAVQAMLGHTSATMTLDLYGHLFDDDLDAVGRALDSLRPQVTAV